MMACLLSGLKVIPIKPELVLNPSNGMSNYVFDKQPMLDIGVTIQQYTSTTNIRYRSHNTTVYINY